VHPALDGARVLAEPPRDLVAAEALGDQQHAVQPVQVALLVGRPDCGADPTPRPLIAATAAWDMCSRAATRRSSWKGMPIFRSCAGT
jgi:hypothetical protein